MKGKNKFSSTAKVISLALVTIVTFTIGVILSIYKDNPENAMTTTNLNLTTEEQTVQRLGDKVSKLIDIEQDYVVLAIQTMVDNEKYVVPHGTIATKTRLVLSEHYPSSRGKRTTLFLVGDAQKKFLQSDIIVDDVVTVGINNVRPECADGTGEVIQCLDFTKKY